VILDRENAPIVLTFYDSFGFFRSISHAEARKQQQETMLQPTAPPL
jgi:hypothetical protein